MKNTLISSLSLLNALGMLLSPHSYAGRVGTPASVPSPAPSSLPVREFKDEIERDYGLRAHGQLHITNLRGDIVIHGWSLDKIKVKAIRRVMAPNAEAAKPLFSAVDLRFGVADSTIELSAEFGKNLGLQDRLRERKDPKTSMEMVVYAPANLRLRVWGVEGQLTVKGWNAPLDVRSSSGVIRVEDVKSGGASVSCPSCAMNLKDIEGPVRCMGGSGAIQIADLDSPHTYVETLSGPVTVSRVSGEQLYVTREGALSGRELTGHIEFHGQSGPIEIVEGRGFLSGRTTSGSIQARMREWSFSDKAVIESGSGDIRLTLPSSFAGDVDLVSGVGKAEIGFPIEKIDERQPAVGQSPGKISGRVGDGGELLKIVSSRGSVQVIRDR